MLAHKFPICNGLNVRLRVYVFEKQYRPIYVPITLGSDLAIYASALARPVIIELGIALRLGLAKARVIL